MNFFTFVATETREWLAKLGVRSLEELIGRVDLLECLPGETAKQQSLDLNPILWVDEDAADQPQFCQVTSNDPFDTAEKAVDGGGHVARYRGGERRYVLLCGD